MISFALKKKTSKRRGPIPSVFLKPNTCLKVDIKSVKNLIILSKNLIIWLKKSNISSNLSIKLTGLPHLVPLGDPRKVVANIFVHGLEGPIVTKKV